MTTRLFKQLRGLRWSETAYTALAALFMLFVLAFASVELLLRPGALFRKVTPTLSVSDAQTPGGDRVHDEPNPSHATDPYASVLDSFKSEKTRQREEEERLEWVRKALEKSIKDALPQAQEKLDQLTQNKSAFEKEVVEVVGTSLDTEPFPDDFARLLATQRTVAEAWTSMKNDRVSNDTLESTRTSLAAITARTQAGTFLEDDRELLAGIIKNLDSKLANQHDLEGSLDHIRAMLEGQRFRIAR